MRGDHPAASTDSRAFGPVPPALVVGRVGLPLPAPGAGREPGYPSPDAAMTFDPAHIERFRYAGYDVDTSRGLLRCTYALDDAVTFVEHIAL